MLDVVLVCAVMVGALALFVSEKVRVDLVALLIMVTLMIIGLFRPNFVTPQEAISGFSNAATVTIGAMFILSGGLVKTGAVTWISQRLLDLGGENKTKLLFLLLITVGIVSAFINNAAAVAIFLPISLTISQQHQISASKILIPLSFASIMGGSCTLIGTSTNILVSSMAADQGFQPFAMFEFTKLGVIFFAAGMLYLFLVIMPRLPDRVGVASLTAKYDIGGYLTAVVVNEKSSLVNTTPAQRQISERYDVNILEIIRGDESIWTGIRNTRLHAGDLLLVRGSIRNIMEMNEMEGLSIRSQLKYADEDLTTEEAVLVESIISPSSSMIGATLKEMEFRKKHGVFALAIRKHGETIRDRVGHIRLDAGDALLLQGKRGFMEALMESTDFLILQELDVPRVRKDKVGYALVIMALVVGLAALNLMPILASALLGCMLMVFTRSIKLEEAYHSIDWLVIFLLAGVIPLGLVMEKTGTAQFIAHGMLEITRILGPVAVISAFYLLSTILASIMSHNATAVLLVPIGVAAAQELGLNPMPFLMAITFAASSSLSTPFGYHTNLMVYGPGGYRFTDYLKAGIPLNIIFWILATIFIPLFWPLS